jgi:protoporphyrinogen IX oxidase
MYEYVKALHIIFVVTWFSGMFYIVRLFIYNTEAGEKPPLQRDVLREQFGVMIRRLWFGITWPSAILTLVFGGWMLYLHGTVPTWLWIKIVFVAGLYVYHFSLHKIYQEQSDGRFRFSGNSLRLWNELATVFLLAIVMLVEVKSAMSLWWGLGGLLAFALLLMSAVRIYKLIRTRNNRG